MKEADETDLWLDSRFKELILESLCFLVRLPWKGEFGIDEGWWSKEEAPKDVNAEGTIKLLMVGGKLEKGSTSSSSAISELLPSAKSLIWNLHETWCLTRPNKGLVTCLIIFVVVVGIVPDFFVLVLVEFLSVKLVYNNGLKKVI